MTRRFLVPLSSDHVDYNIDSESPNAEGRLRWDSDFGTLSIGMDGGDVELPIGQKNGAYVKNESSVNIGKGKAVQFAGAKGGKITIAKAVANGTVDPKFMFGITAEAIDNDDFGFVVTDGYVRGLNTSGIAVGTLLYFDPNAPGELTTTKPTAPAINIPIAVVTFSNAAAGVIFVRMQQEFPLDEIQDIKLTDLANNDALIYNSASAIWENKPNTIDNLSNVTITNIQAGEILKYDSINSRWINDEAPEPIVESGTVLPQEPTNGQFFFNINNQELFFFFNNWKTIGLIEIDLNGGTSLTTEFDLIVDGGSSSTTVFEEIYDGGNSSN
jgi:hypothetical protein